MEININSVNSLAYSRQDGGFTIIPTLLILAALLGGCEQIPLPAGGSQLGAKPDTTVIPIVDAKMPIPTQKLACTDIQAGQLIKVQGHLQLSPNCNLSDKGVQFILDSSDTSLDCQGATLSNNEANASHSAITIRPKADSAISNIAVANCHIHGYGHALHIRQFSDPNRRYAQGFINPEANRAQAPHHIRIINLTSQDSLNSGIFVGDHVHHVSFDRITVARSGTVGLYFEFGSQHNIVQSSVFVDNGFRSFKSNREAIAIDSSAFNTIKNNQFIHNGAGSIYLYRNCFEHADDASQSNHFKRTESASNNIITGNTFRDEPVGVWIASRQSRNLKGFACGAYLLAETAFARYHIDSAKNNRIESNTFINVDTGIIVEDDGTQIIANDFTQARGVPVKVGSEILQKYGKQAGVNPEIVGTVLEDNKMLNP